MLDGSIAISTTPITRADDTEPIDDGPLLPLGRRADQEAGLEVLRGRAAVAGGDAHDRRHRKRQQAIGRRGPTEHKKIRHVNSNVAMVMPEIGLLDEPISPVKREETVTKRNPKSTINTAAARLTPGDAR